MPLHRVPGAPLAFAANVDGYNNQQDTYLHQISPLYRTDAKPRAEAACRLCRGAKEEEAHACASMGDLGGATRIAMPLHRVPGAPLTFAGNVDGY